MATDVVDLETGIRNKTSDRVCLPMFSVPAAFGCEITAWILGVFLVALLAMGFIRQLI